MVAFPTNIAKPKIEGFTENTSFPTIRTESEAGYEITRRRALKARKTFDLSWSAMTDTDYQLLMTFFETYVGGSFTWTHPKTFVEYTVTFAEDEIEAQRINDSYVSVSIKLKEV